MKERQAQKSSMFVGLVCFSLVLMLLQLWLFVSALEGLIAGHSRMALPGLLASLAIFAVNVWMLRGLARLEDAP